MFSMPFSDEKEMQVHNKKTQALAQHRSKDRFGEASNRSGKAR